MTTITQPVPDTGRLPAFQRITALIAGSLDLKETLDAIVYATCELLGTEDALIAFRESGSEQFVLHPHAAHAQDERFEHAFRHSLWDAVGLSVMRTRQPHIVRDSGSTTLGDFAPAPLPAARSWICVPLVSKDAAIGALYAFNGRPTDFSADDVLLATLLSNQAAIAIANARLHEQTSRRLRESEALFRVAQAMARNLPLDVLLQLAVDQITAFVPHAGKAVIHLLDGEVLRPRAVAPGAGTAAQSLAMRAGSGIAGRALSQRRVQNVADTRADPDFLDQGTGLRALIVAPLMSGETVIGTLSVDSTAPRAFDSDSLRLVESLASHAAVAIERARLHEQTLAEKRRSETIINNLVDGVMLLDTHQRIVLINPMLATMVGLYGKDLRGMRIADAPYPLPSFWQDMPQAAGGSPVTAYEVKMAPPSNQIFKVYVSVVGDNSDGGQGFVLVAHDVTSERRLDQAKTDFISTVSHELRTPLFSIRGFVKLLAAGKVPDEATRQEFLAIVSQEADQLTTIVNDLLEVTRLDAGYPVDLRLADVDMLALATEALGRFKAMAEEKHVALNAHLPERLPRVRADNRRLGQVLVNLLGNALKFTPEGGWVSLECDASDPNTVTFSVVDSGVGIPPEAIPRLFERFYQVDQTKTRRAGGTGLGLYISRQIVEAHGGRIGVTSTPGQGSRFWFSVPRALDRAK